MDKHEFMFRTDFYYGNDIGSVLALAALMDSEPGVAKTVREILKTAQAGNCTAVCVTCGAEIKSLAELAGYAYFQGGKRGEITTAHLLSVICAKCHALGHDIVESRFSDLMNKKLFDNKATLYTSAPGGEES